MCGCTKDDVQCTTKEKECFGTSSLVLYGVNLRKRDLYLHISKKYSIFAAAKIMHLFPVAVFPHQRDNLV